LQIVQVLEVEVQAVLYLVVPEALVAVEGPVLAVEVDAQAAGDSPTHVWVASFVASVQAFWEQALL